MKLSEALKKRDTLNIGEKEKKVDFIRIDPVMGNVKIYFKDHTLVGLEDVNVMIEENMDVGAETCKYCDNNEKMESECAEYSVRNRMLCVDYSAYSGDSSFYEELEIEYCPKCGKKL